MEMVRSQENEEFQNLDCVSLYCYPGYEGFRFFSLGSQDVHHGASGVQQLPLREYGGMRN